MAYSASVAVSVYVYGLMWGFGVVVRSIGFSLCLWELSKKLQIDLETSQVNSIQNYYTWLVVISSNFSLLATYDFFKFL